MDKTEAWAEFLETVGEAALKLANQLRDQDDAVASEVALAVVAGETNLDRDPLALDLGSAQRPIVKFLVDNPSPEGWKPREIGRGTGRDDEPNVRICLDGLEKRRIVEKVPARTPMRYRLTARWRAAES
jgi:hypothetical protein